MINSTEVKQVPVVLLHGWAGSVRTSWGPLRWEGCLRDAGFEPLAIDLLGHGAADTPHDPEDYANIVQDTAMAFEEYDVVDVIAYSMGAKIALALAAQRPERFRRIVLAGVGENVFRPEAVGTVADCLQIGLTAAVPARVRDLAAIAFASGNDLDALAACMRRPSTPLTVAQARQIDIPVLVVVGACDGVAGSAEPLVEALPDAQLLVIPGIDHVGTTYSVEFRTAAVEFLSGA
ncbi:alpha/beta fold hydrolase [Nocardia sp. NPDC004860]|uniref:alpha/beta fold hydrolase n=1 Tax=Nocardia sp. NPDC004860 TaxID=3154557 RepID=UPI0033AA3A72